MTFVLPRRITAAAAGLSPTATRIRPISTRLCVIAAGWLLLMGPAGCSGPGLPDAAAPPAESPVESPPLPTLQGESPQPELSGAVDREIWEICSIGGQRVGYGRTSITSQTRHGRDVLEIQIYNHLAVKRFGEEFQTELRSTSSETPDGRLIEFTSEIPQGNVPTRVTGFVRGDQLQLTINTQGKSLTSVIPWKDRYGGPYAVQLSLIEQPMTPGRQRSVEAFEVGANMLATNTLAAQEYEKVDLPDGPKDLLRIETTTTLAGQVLRGTIWTDLRGNVWKNRMDAMDLETVRVTKALALGESQPAAFDLGRDVMVPADRHLDDPHHTRRIQYLVRLEGDEPAAVFSSGPSQRVEPIAAGTARVTVWSIRPGSDSGNADAAPDPPGEDDRAANSLIQSDDPAIIEMARRAAGADANPWATVVALEGYVHGYITETNFSTGFASAAEVALSKTGDCTEHAVLLAALIRARQIPARVAIGLVYYQQAYAYHMWTEAYVQGRWIPLDATLGQGGIGAAHLKVAHSNLQGASPYSTLLPVLKVIGRLKIELQEVE